MASLGSTTPRQRPHAISSPKTSSPRPSRPRTSCSTAACSSSAVFSIPRTSGWKNAEKSAPIACVPSPANAFHQLLAPERTTALCVLMLQICICILRHCSFATPMPSNSLFTRHDLHTVDPLVTGRSFNKALALDLAGTFVALGWCIATWCHTCQDFTLTAGHLLVTAFNALSMHHQPVESVATTMLRCLMPVLEMALASGSTISAVSLQLIGQAVAFLAVAILSGDRHVLYSHLPITIIYVISVIVALGRNLSPTPAESKLVWRQAAAVQRPQLQVAATTGPHSKGWSAMPVVDDDGGVVRGGTEITRRVVAGLDDKWPACEPCSLAERWAQHPLSLRDSGVSVGGGVAVEAQVATPTAPRLHVAALRRERRDARSTSTSTTGTQVGDSSWEGRDGVEEGKVAASGALERPAGQSLGSQPRAVVGGAVGSVQGSEVRRPAFLEVAGRRQRALLTVGGGEPTPTTQRQQMGAAIGGDREAAAPSPSVRREVGEVREEEGVEAEMPLSPRNLGLEVQAVEGLSGSDLNLQHLFKAAAAAVTAAEAAVDAKTAAENAANAAAQVVVKETEAALHRTRSAQVLVSAAMQAIAASDNKVGFAPHSLSEEPVALPPATLPVPQNSVTTNHPNSQQRPQQISNSNSSNSHSALLANNSTDGGGSAPGGRCEAIEEGARVVDMAARGKTVVVDGQGGLTGSGWSQFVAAVWGVGPEESGGTVARIVGAMGTELSTIVACARAMEEARLEPYFQWAKRKRQELARGNAVWVAAPMVNPVAVAAIQGRVADGSFETSALTAQSLGGRAPDQLSQLSSLFGSTGSSVGATRLGGGSVGSGAYESASMGAAHLDAAAASMRLLEPRGGAAAARLDAFRVLFANGWGRGMRGGEDDLGRSLELFGPGMPGHMGDNTQRQGRFPSRRRMHSRMVPVVQVPAFRLCVLLARERRLSVELAQVRRH